MRSRRRVRRFGARTWKTTFLALLVAAVYSLATKHGRDGGAPPPLVERPRAEERSGARLSVEVTRVVDGDTVALADGRQVRYLGLDSAEAGEPWAEEARLENLRLVEGRTADLWLAGKSAEDHYGRLLAVVYLAGSTGEGGEPACVNQRLLSRGLAWVYLVSPDALPESILARFLAAQGEAISARRGLWRNRLQAPEAEREALVSTRLRLHRRSCPEIRATATRPVSSLEEEFRKGKSPCRKCRPMDG